MTPRPFVRTTFARLNIGTCFADPHFDDRKPIPAKCGLSDFTTAYARHGMFIKIHPDFAYRDGPTRLEEAVLRYPPEAEIICGNAAGFNGDKISDPLVLELVGKIMEMGPAGTDVEHILRIFRTYDSVKLEVAITKLTTKPRPQYQPILARLDRRIIRLTSDGIRLALSEGYKFVPSNGR